MAGGDCGGIGADFAVYYAQADVDYTFAPGTWRQKIGIQKWLSLFNNGLEGWTAWRLLDFTAFAPPSGMVMGDIPTRFIYPISEATLNPSNYDAAAAKFNDDSMTAKIFWDVN